MDKKKRISIILGVIVLLSLIIGATYAYFQVTTSGSTTSTLAGDIQEVGSVTLIGVDDSGTISLDAEDTSILSIDTDYTYPESGTPEVIATISASGTQADNITYYCKVDVTITNTVTNGTLNSGDVSISYGGYLANKLTKNSTNLFNSTYLTTTDGVASGSVSKTSTDVFTIKSGDSFTLTKLVTIHNTVSDQQNLKGLSFTTQTELSNLICDTSNIGSSIFSPIELLNAKKGTDGLSDHVAGDLYRYQGNGQVCSYDNGNYKELNSTGTCSNKYSYSIAENESTTNYTYEASCPDNADTDSCVTYTGTVIGEEVNNYICIGASTCSTDKNVADSHTYRILGITEEGNLKVISMFNDGNRQWAPENTLEYDWSNSPLQLYLNSTASDGFLYKLGDFQDLVLTKDWYYTKTFDMDGDTKVLRDTVNYISATGNATTQYTKDTDRTLLATLSAKVGLMNLSDYYFTNCDTCGFSTTGWLNYLMKNCNNTLNRSYEKSEYYVCFDHIATNSIGLTNAYGLLPVFYLSSDIYLSGSGSKSNPYVLIG